jgi:Ser/Thr protein kinase RdoA (MazF antagonist)
MNEDSPATDLFLSLTPEKVLAAVEAAGLCTQPVCYPLNSFENRVYEVELADRTRVIAKFYRPGRWTAEQILEEHRFIDDLARAEIPVATVRPFPDGTTLQQIDHIYYTLANRRGGRAPDEITDELALRLGRLAGRMHNVGAARPAEHRWHMTTDRFVREPLAWLEAHGTLPPAFRERYFKAARAIAEIADERLAGVPVHRIHGDLHTGNLLLRDDLLNVLDFDDMVMGPAVQDLWLALPGRDRFTAEQRELFLEGYEQFREFDRRTLHLIEPLRAMRIVHYSAWLARRWHDPVFPVTWPHFGAPDYWERETAELEELLLFVRGEAPLDEQGHAVPRAEAAPAEEEALSNKDFFWDWEG